MDEKDILSRLEAARSEIVKGLYELDPVERFHVANTLMTALKDDFIADVASARRAGVRELRGSNTLEGTAKLLGVTRARIDQIVNR